ncbi:hypothetical protein LGT41_0015275 [Abyssibius alkaniclasticus]|uniref:hypothetical protein n=1 Tax=Abyssibius alkaniclasticus TaxID=2881234 RepID=UPI0023648407|nr:hypothetical protein [Abyssibius alkaniclasticus]UPH71123.1 hypothetical protein LGT41_0015275 [Abyssibius alkaniclasticus]
MRSIFVMSAFALTVLAGCEAALTESPSYSAPAASSGTSVEVNDAIAGQLESATRNGNVNIWSYFPDTVTDIAVLDGADRVCGGPGRAKAQTNPIFTVSSQAGRTLHTMTFVCG